MISQKCPKCLSKRVRRGYRPTPIWSKIIFRYNLLCDNCNWEFTGFAVPGTVSAKPTKSAKKNQTVKKNENFKDKPTDIPVVELPQENIEELVSLDTLTVKKKKARKKGQS